MAFLIIAGAGQFEVTRVSGREAIGVSSDFEVHLLTTEPLDPKALLGKVTLFAFHPGARAIAGVVTEISAKATSLQHHGREYRLQLRSFFARLELSQRPRIFQHLSVPDIIKQTLTEAGYGDAQVVMQLSATHAEREYVVRYGETDAAFVRRLCEDDGLYFRFEAGDDGEHIVFEDDTSNAPSCLVDPILLNDVPLSGPGAHAWDCLFLVRRRPGKVTLRDYDYLHPTLALDRSVKAGTPVEQGVEVYEAPGGFATTTAGDARAKLRLEQLRCDAQTITFQTDALDLAVGGSFELALAEAVKGAAPPAGPYVVTAIEWDLRPHEGGRGGKVEMKVTALPKSVPFRLPRATPRARIHGAHVAHVTGPSGSEVHTDAEGRVHLRFPWDREGPTDDKSSLPVRTMQPNTPGSVTLPRVGWEVVVMFEDGDPDRPLVLGRQYNAKSPPPVSLPKNKTMTSVATLSSPGGAKQNAITFDDAGGAQHMVIGAGFGKATTVGNKMFTQTTNNESLSVGASQGRSVSASENVSVKQSYLVGLGSQSATVGGTQKIFVKGDMVTGVGSETVLVGGAVIEKVGNPVAGAANLAKSAALSGISSLGTAGSLFAQGAGLAEGAVAGFQQGGWRGAAAAVGSGVAGSVASALVPGGGELLGAITSAAPPAPWSEASRAAGAGEAGGGAAGASASAGARGPGPGHRTTDVKGAMTELIGALCAMASPGNIGSTVIGASTILVGGSHSTTTKTAAARVMGASSEVVGSLKIKSSGAIVREVKGALNTTIAGTLKSDAGGAHSITAGGALTIKVGGALTLDASSITIECGGSQIIAGSGGVTLKASTITVTGASKQTGKTAHEP